MTDRKALQAWFVQEVLPLEPALMAFLRRNWRDPEEIIDFRQEVYAKLFSAAAAGERPANVRGFAFTVARNLLINQARRAAIVSFDLVADLEEVQVPPDGHSPERIAVARDELRRLRAAVAQLPPRCQEVFLLRKVEGLSHNEIAERIGMSPRTVESHLTRGIRAVTALMFGRPETKEGGASTPADGVGEQWL